MRDILSNLTKIEKTLGDIEKRFGKGVIRRFNEPLDKDIGVIPTGIYSLDKALGIGGFPKGRICEVYGVESGGKSTLCLTLAAQCQKQGGIVVYFDMEQALAPQYCEDLGINLDDMLVSQPTSGDDCLEMAENITRSGQASLIIIDSVSALVPKSEINGEIGDNFPGLQARLMGSALRKLSPIANETKTCIVFVNQIRNTIGVTWGSNETTSGGKALRFYASIRLDVRRIGQLKVDDKVVGNRTKIKVIKNKLSIPFKETEVSLIFGEGFSREDDILEIAIKQDVIHQAGSWFSMGEVKLGQGKENIRKKLKDDPKFYDLVRSKLT